MTHLSSFESIFIHCTIFWLSFSFDVIFFVTCFSTYSSKGALPFRFITVLVFDLGCLWITLQTSSSKSLWKNSFPLSFTCCYNFSSSTGLNVGACSDCSLATSRDKISTSSSKFEIIITCGARVVVEVVVFLRKLRAALNSSSNSLFSIFVQKN